jgi:hypothetical protein
MSREIADSAARSSKSASDATLDQRLRQFERAELFDLPLDFDPSLRRQRQVLGVNRAKDCDLTEFLNQAG